MTFRPEIQDPLNWMIFFQFLFYCCCSKWHQMGLLCGIQLTAELVWRIQDGFVHISGVLADTVVPQGPVSLTISSPHVVFSAG